LAEETREARMARRTPIQTREDRKRRTVSLSKMAVRRLRRYSQRGVGRWAASRALSSSDCS
jgi:hypothetical protein